eukprot:GHVT01090391.1.p1 GENE.GHVT01090391.1~~GHVT01090391.1.p1  ORF type:complete len:332 (-),score=54.17 GHVT01090391.1:857-1852(-)
MNDDSIEEMLRVHGSDYTHVITGYVASAEALEEITSYVRALKRHGGAAVPQATLAGPAQVRRMPEQREKNKTLHTGAPPLCPEGILWLCDPVLGDNEKLYVAEELVDAFRRLAVPYADILTPNAYELKWLTGLPVQTVSEAGAACARLMTGTCMRLCVVTSVECHGDRAGWLALVACERTCVRQHSTTSSQEQPKKAIDFAGRDIEKEEGEQPIGSRSACKQHQRQERHQSLAAQANDFQAFAIYFRRHNCHLYGTGDLMAAVFLAAYIRHNGRVKDACNAALNVVQAVIAYTIATSPTAPGVDVVAGQHLLDLETAPLFECLPIALEGNP